MKEASSVGATSERTDHQGKSIIDCDATPLALHWLMNGRERPPRVTTETIASAESGPKTSSRPLRPYPRLPVLATLTVELKG